MKIIQLVLHRYKRFKLGRIETFTYQVEQKSQIILGTNGSGKSSLMSELSPLPARSKHFYEGGYKEITIEHQGSMYVLRSEWNNKHSYLKDDVEKNDGHTLSVQRQLVLQDFRLDEKVFSILMGKVNFCGMGVGDRRKWLTDLSDNDYEYVGEVYNRLKTRLLEKASEKKTVTEMMHRESQQVLDDAAIQGLRDEIQDCRDAVNALMGLKFSVQQDGYQISNLVRMLEDESAVSIGRLRRQLTALNGTMSQQMGYTEVVEEKERLRDNIQQQEGQLSILVEQFDEVQKKIEAYSSAPDQEMISHDIQTVENQLARLPALEVENVELVYSVTRGMETDIVNALIELPDNADKRFSKQNLQVIETRLAECQALLLQLKKEQDGYRQILNVQEECKTHHLTECPECHYQWRIGFSQKVYDKAKENLTLSVQEIDQLEKEIEDLQGHRGNILNYANQYKYLMTFFRSQSHLDYLYERIKEDIVECPQRAINRVRETLNILREQLTVSQLQSDRERLKQSYAQASETSAQLREEKKQERDKLEEDIFQLTARIKNAKQMLNALTHQLEVYAQIDKEIQSLKAKLEQFEQLSLEQYKFLVNKEIESFTSTLMSEMVQYQNTLSGMEQRIETLHGLQEKSEMIQKDIEAVKILEEILSPKGGLIADSLTGFINEILNYITRFVNEVWTYPVEILPVGVDGEEALDYRFKVLIDDNQEIDDISEGSSGLQEIINLGFKICVMSYLNFKDYPLYLDEFGSTFDIQHRLNATWIVNNLIGDDMFSNIFMIFHYAESYGAMQNSDIVVMHDGNLSIPGDMQYNQHVDIVRN